MRRNLPVYACEFAGTALMLFWGVSAVAFMWGAGSPIPAIGNAALRRLVTGLLFAGGATAVVYSLLGRRSGGHINPAVTLAFWRLGNVPGRDVPWYLAAQFAGASATVTATSEAQLRRVNRDSFGRVLAEDPVWTQELLRQRARLAGEA